MSATGRGASTGYVREPDDFFKTPAWCTRAILGHLCPDVEDTDLQLLDPCCGTGAILRVDRMKNPRSRLRDPSGLEGSVGDLPVLTIADLTEVSEFFAFRPGRRLKPAGGRQCGLDAKDVLVGAAVRESTAP